MVDLRLGREANKREAVLATRVKGKVANNAAQSVLVEMHERRRVADLHFRLPALVKFSLQ